MITNLRMDVFEALDSLHSSSGQERQEGRRGSYLSVISAVLSRVPGCVVTAHVGGLWPLALAPDRMSYVFVYLLITMNKRSRSSQEEL